MAAARRRALEQKLGLEVFGGSRRLIEFLEQKIQANSGLDAGRGCI